MSLTYNQVRELILKTLEERPAGTKVEVPNQQNYELALLDYFQQLETTMSTSLVGIATAETTPIEPPQARVAYLAQQASSTTTVFENFMDGEGNPITITTDVDHVAFITLFWNTQYWSYQAVMIPVIYPGGDVLTKDVVSELPETGKENVVYLIVDPKDPTAYTMHMWLNGAWATVGGTTGAVRYDQVQELTEDQQAQALKNVGLDVMFVTVTNDVADLTYDQLEQIKTCKCVVIDGSTTYEAAVRRLYYVASVDGSKISLYSLVSDTQVIKAVADPGSRKLTVDATPSMIVDSGAVRFTPQTLSVSDQTQVWANLGLKIIVLPYSKVGTALTDDELTTLSTADGVQLVNGVLNEPHLFLRGSVGTTGYPLFYAFVSSSIFRYLFIDSQTKELRASNIPISDSNAIAVAALQTFSVNQRNVALRNIGLDYVIIEIEGTTTTLTQAQEDAMLAAKGVILLGTTNYEPTTRRVFTAGQTNGTIVNLYALLSGNQYLLAQYRKNTKVLSVDGIAQNLVPDAVKFSVQNLSDPQKAQARANIGIDLTKLLTSSSIKGVEIVNEGEAPSEQNGILYIEVKPDTNA